MSSQSNKTKPDLILHIGSEKTGSTSFQAFCCERAPVLKGGVRFPADNELPGSYRGNHLGLPLVAGSIKAWEGAIGEVYGGIGVEVFEESFLEGLEKILFEDSTNEDWHTLLLSNEHLSSLMRFVDVQMLHERLSKYFDRIKVVLVRRNKSEALVSQWTTFIRDGETTDSLKRWTKDNRYSDTFDYQNLKAMWATLGCSVEIVEFDSADALSPLFRVCSIEESLPEKVYRSNISYGPLTSDLIRLSNKLRLGNSKLGKRIQTRLAVTMERIIPKAYQVTMIWYRRFYLK